jgi:hypothetical protein
MGQAVSLLCMRLTLDPLRSSLLAALGLLACGPIDNTTDGSESGGASGTGTGSATGSTTNNPTTSATNETTTAGPTSDVTSDATSDVTGNPTVTDPTATDTNATTTTATDGPVTATSTSDTSGETGAPACEGTLTQIDQAFTEPATPSGFVQCDAGIIHRAEALACGTPVTPNSCIDNIGEGCKVDADCVEKPFGSCQETMVFGGFTVDGCNCVYGCQTDADCGDGQICRCAGAGLGLYTECIQAGCVTDADCPAGEVCGLSPDICAPGGFQTACTTPGDTCDSDDDCAAPPCGFNGTFWECSNAACGRPFLVDAQAVLAAATARDDWRAIQRAPAPVDAELAVRLAAHWTTIGRLEHASVAAFAQFILQLLAVAAPASLVSAAQQALADEVEHARLCFGLASLYGGSGVGPGPLAISGAGAHSELPALIDAVIREACLGETLAAFEAREAAAQAADPAVRATLEQIARDELRHAELGWRFVQWALVDADEAAHARARATFAAAVAEARRGVERDAAAAGSPELRAHGVVDEPLRARVWAEGLVAVIEPCAAALLDRRAA